MSKLNIYLASIAIALFVPIITSFSNPTTNRFVKNLQLKSSFENEETDRRNILNRFATAFTFAIAAPKEVLADPENLNAFNSLTFNYRGSDFGGLDASTLNEPSIKYSDFLKKLDSGEVVFVQFLAPDGDVAYATLKSSTGEGTQKPIRIGQGYPIEQHDGWSSPAFAVRSVKEKGVSYKFTVPALANYK